MSQKITAFLGMASIVAVFLYSQLCLYVQEVRLSELTKMVEELKVQIHSLPTQCASVYNVTADMIF